MKLLCLISVIPLVRSAATTVTIPKADTSAEFIERFNVIAQGIVEAVGVMNNCSSSIFEKFVKDDKSATFENLKACVKEKVDFEKQFKKPLQDYKAHFTQLVEAEKAALTTKSESANKTLKEKAAKLRAKLEQFGKTMLSKLKAFGVMIKESDFVQGMKKAAEDMKNKVDKMFDKIKNFFG
ncbi:hypothetical protein PRIPAC_80846 [Pristionchus pacificus]|uniref:Uncharacterized protein n=1 Tax=Pristionchus pacificus TaxID=54126 RepID=A0A2A6CPZ5_PRIPA|nr:hypothetical protein PRIPAC_80846 [Pristionchus pacificus]|eukprot:PDM80127.1 hypothetical protein PRIPAC_32706 [Pristionchus pacificus]